MGEIHRTKSIVPFVLGMGLGAVAALILAPKAGKDLRNDIGESVSGGAEYLGSSSKELKQRIGEVVAQAQDNVHEAFEAGQNAYRQAKNA